MRREMDMIGRGGVCGAIAIAIGPNYVGQTDPQ